MHCHVMNCFLNNLKMITCHIVTPLNRITWGQNNLIILNGNDSLPANILMILLSAIVSRGFRSNRLQRRPTIRQKRIVVSVSFSSLYVCFKCMHGIANGIIDWIEKMADWQKPACCRGWIFIILNNNDLDDQIRSNVV